MDDVFQFALTFKEFPPRSFPPSFVPTNIVEETLDDIKDSRARAGERAQKHRQDPLGRTTDDRSAAPAAWDQVRDAASVPARPRAGRTTSLFCDQVRR
jgi:hypothetical protein